MTQNSTFQPTLLQKLLGRNYKWWYTISYNFNRGNGDFFGILMQQFGVIQTTGAVALIWFINQSGTNLIYILFGRLFFALSYNDYQLRLGSRIINGKISNSLLLPQNIFLEGFMVSIGYRMGLVLMNILGSISVILLFWLIDPSKFYFPQDLKNYIVFLLLPLSFVMNYLFGVVIGSSAFFIKDKLNFDGITQAFVASTAVLSGSMVPLNQISFLKFLEFLPFAWLLHHPMQIYLGKYTPVETFYVFLGGIAWCIALYFLAKLVFKMGLKRNESVGL